MNADGVHLGQNDMCVEEARRILGAKMIGGTANTYSEVETLIRQGVDYIGLGPFRYTPTKEKLSPILEPEGYASVFRKLSASDLSIPVVAIGGVRLGDVSKLRAVGLQGVAIA